MSNQFDETKFLSAIEKTGFDLEFYVQTILRSHGWHVINNRFYVDDLKGTEREIDIVAYKVKSTKKMDYRTTLIISCKKVSESYWAFMTSNRDDTDSDFDYCPLCVNSSNTAVSYMLNNERNVLVDRLLAENEVSSLFAIPRKVFAFQQINKNSYKTEDDKRIFDSIITAIKAASYEMQNDTKNKKKYCNSYFLISVLDGEMKEVAFDEDGTKNISDIEEIHYINRHIVGGKDDFYQVHFITKNHLDKSVALYDKLADYNLELYDWAEREFYNFLLADEHKDRAQDRWRDFQNKFMSEMWDDYMDPNRNVYNNSYITDYKLSEDGKQIKMYWNLSLFSNPDFLIKNLQKDKKLQKCLKKYLWKYFHYKGEVILVRSKETYI